MRRQRRGLGCVAGMLLAAVLAGCDGSLYDFWGDRREEASNLLLRVESGDQAAYARLQALAAGARGDPYAAADLGYVHHIGLGGHAVDLDRAMMEYDKATRLIVEADYNAGLIELRRSRYEAAASRFGIAAGGAKRNGLPLAMVQLATIYEAGKAGAPVSASLAAEWFEYAAQQDSLYAKGKLALILLEGKGRGKDVRRGISLLEQAAVRGDRAARIAMAAIHARPIVDGVAVNVELAAQWYLVGATGSAELERAANGYLSALTADQQRFVTDAVTLFRASDSGIIDPPDLNTPLRIMKASS